MTLKIITDGSIRSLAAVPASAFERSIRLLSGKVGFKSITPAKLPEPIKNNMRLLRDAQMAQDAMSELYAIRRQAVGLRAQFASLDIHSLSFDADVAAIRQVLANPPAQKVVSLFKSEDNILFQKAWQELGLVDITGSAAKALSILDRLDARIVCMLRHHEQVLLDTVIARENIAALMDKASQHSLATILKAKPSSSIAKPASSIMVGQA